MIQQRHASTRLSRTFYNLSNVLLFIAASLTDLSSSFSVSREIISQHNYRPLSILHAEEIDRKSALIGGLLGGYTLFELSGAARKVENSTGIGIGRLKNATIEKN